MKNSGISAIIMTAALFLYGEIIAALRKKGLLVINIPQNLTNN